MVITALMTAAAGVGAPQPPAPSLLETFGPILLIFVVFWFLILRPQQKRMKEHREMVAGAKRGDTVVTSGGIVGKVTKVKDDDDELEVEIAEGVRVRVVKSTLTDVRVKGEPQAASAKASNDS